MIGQPKCVLTIESCASDSGWSVFQISLGRFAVRQELRPVLGEFYAALDEQVTPDHPQLAVFLQFNQMRNENAGLRLSEHAREWMPEMGLGYEPHRPPPTLWSREDFMNLGIGEMPRELMHQLLLVTADEVQSRRAVNEMAGLGPVLLMRGLVQREEFTKVGNTRFRPMVQDIGLKNFPWLVPLLSLETFRSANAETLQRWACGVTFYLRESPADQAILIASDKPLASALAAAGAKQEKQGVWNWSPAST